MALYLKYRPQTLDDLIGQENVKNSLSAPHQRGNLSHAYLFFGPRGTGKTSTARILAKMVNCEEKNSPCNKCATCVSITDGSNLDLIEIDAASNRGIDDIRSLRENIKLAPTSGKKKVYIIDEVHMLTTEAFNALLKTLEEPPSHAFFILATTEINKIPQTILSRVQKLDFKLASPSDIELALSKIVKAEGIKIDEKALKLLAKKADGSFRDGVKLLDQLSSEGQNITEEMVEKSLGASNFEAICNLLSNLAEKKAGEALKELTLQNERGVGAKELGVAILDTLRALLFIKSDLGPLVKEDSGSSKYESLVSLAGKFSEKDLTNSINIFQQASERLKFTSIPTLPLEVAVVEVCEDNSKFKIQNSKLEEVREVVVRGGDERGAPMSAHSEARTSIGAVSRQDPEPSGLEKTSQEITTSPDVIKIQEKWTFVLETIRQNNFSLEALLRSVKIVDCHDGQVLIEVPYAFHQRILEGPKSRDLLEAVLSDVLEKPIRVATVLGSRPARVEDIANVEVAADDEVISLASEIFNGKLVD